MKAIILKKNLFSEGSEIITFYTRDFGKIKAVARSVKSARSKLAFALQSLFYSEIELSSRSGKLATLSPISGVRPIETFKRLRKDNSRVFRALHATELILKSTADEQPNPDLFDEYLGYLTHLNEYPLEHKGCADVFTLRALGHVGYTVQFSKCLVCSKGLEPGSGIYFSNRKGGLLCEECASKSADAKRISSELAKALAQPLSYEQWDQGNMPSSELHNLAESFAKHILERDLNAGKYLL